MSKAFEQHGIDHLSSSQINTWIAAPSYWVLNKLMGVKGSMGCAAHRGTATESGVSAGLFDHALSAEDCTGIALPLYDRATALNGDPNRDKERAAIPGMVEIALQELRPRGVPIRPNGDQHKIEIQLEGVSVPIVGYLDWMYETEVIDLKTTLRVPSQMSESHLRQATIYKVAIPDKRNRFFYTSDKKSVMHTLNREQYDKALTEITGAARRLERFLSLSTDRHELAAMVPHSSESFYFSDSAVKAEAVKVFGY